MNTCDHIQSKAYCGDPSYDAFTGRVVRTYVQKLGITDDGYVIGRVTRVIDIGKADPVTPSDPEAAMGAERLTYDDPKTAAKFEASRDAVQVMVERRRNALKARVVEYLTGRGYVAASEITKALNSNHARMTGLLQDSPEFVSVLDGLVYWALAGTPYAPRKSQKVQALRDLLAQHGPQTATELAERVGRPSPAVTANLREHPDWFTVVRVWNKPGSKPTRVWGLLSTNEESEL